MTLSTVFCQEKKAKRVFWVVTVSSYWLTTPNPEGLEHQCF